MLILVHSRLIKCNMKAVITFLQPKSAEILKGMWLGASGINGAYTWSSSNTAVNFTNWADNQPDRSGNKNCLLMVSGADDGKWSSASCNGEDAALPKQATFCERLLFPK